MRRHEPAKPDLSGTGWAKAAPAMTSSSRSRTTGVVLLDVQTSSTTSRNFLVVVCAITKISICRFTPAIVLTNEDLTRISQHDGP